MSAWNRALIFGRLNHQIITFGILRKIEPKLMNLKGHVWAHLLGVQHLSLANPHPQVGLSQSCFPPLPQITSCGSPWLNMRPGPLQTLPISSHDIPPLHNSEYEFMRYYNVWYFIHRSNIRGQYRLNPNKSWQIVWVDKNAEEISSVVKSSRSVRCQFGVCSASNSAAPSSFDRLLFCRWRLTLKKVGWKRKHARKAQ